MPRLGRLPVSQPVSVALGKGLMCLAMMLVCGRATAQKVPASSEGQPIETADEAKARELFQTIEWADGPGTVELGTFGALGVPRGFIFTGVKGARTFLELGQSPAPDGLLGILAPAESLDWFIILRSGPALRKDDGKGKPDADAILRTLRQENEAQNAVRRAHGWSECPAPEWEISPSYEGSRHDLTWATRFVAEGEPTVNYTTRIFGRNGVVDADLVVSQKEFARVRPVAANILSLVEFPGETNDGRDSETRSTDNGPSDYRHRAPSPRRLVKSTRLLGGLIAAVIFGISGAVKKLKYS